MPACHYLKYNIFGVEIKVYHSRHSGQDVDRELINPYSRDLVEILVGILGVLRVRSTPQACASSGVAHIATSFPVRHFCKIGISIVGWRERFKVPSGLVFRRFYKISFHGYSWLSLKCVVASRQTI